LEVVVGAGAEAEELEDAGTLLVATEVVGVSMLGTSEAVVAMMVVVVGIDGLPKSNGGADYDEAMIMTVL
jgi:hypothetical protein